MQFEKLDWPLMVNNITEDDRNAVVEFLKTDPILTQNKKVEEFEEAWSKWLGVKYSVFVNSGASANLITMRIAKIITHYEKMVVPTLTWISDISSTIDVGFSPIFSDISPQTLGIDFSKIGNQEKAPVFVTHVMGLSAFKDDSFKKTPFLIEDCCECHGASYLGQKLGTFGTISNFSFYYGHHLSTIEGGMICTDDEPIYETARMLRSHGLLREIKNKELKKRQHELEAPHLPSEFVFLMGGYNMRSTEINAVIGLSQLRRLDENNEKRKKNFEVFLNGINPSKYRTDFWVEGSVNYALTLVLKEPNPILRNDIETLLRASQVEFRRGLSGGGNQLRQPYLNSLKWEKEKFKEVEHISDYAWYIGNYPDLPHEKIHKLCHLLNQV